VTPEEHQDAASDVLAVIFGNCARDLAQFDQAGQFGPLKASLGAYVDTHAQVNARRFAAADDPPDGEGAPTRPGG
jgi:hypothetical protein